MSSALSTQEIGERKERILRSIKGSLDQRGERWANQGLEKCEGRSGGHPYKVAKPPDETVTLDATEVHYEPRGEAETIFCHQGGEPCLVFNLPKDEHKD